MSNDAPRETSEVAAAYTLAEAAAYLQVHPETVRRWIVDGLLPAKRIGIRGVYRVKRDDLDQMVKVA